MRLIIAGFLASTALLTAAPGTAAEITYSFDTVTAIELHHNRPGIRGIEKTTGEPLVVTFKDSTNVSYRYVVNRCVPVFLTALEKPGRYFLYVTIDPNEGAVQLVSCRLEVKS